MWADLKKNRIQFIINPKDPVHKLDVEGINNWTKIRTTTWVSNNYLRLFNWFKTVRFKNISRLNTWNLLRKLLPLFFSLKCRQILLRGELHAKKTGKFRNGKIVVKQQSLQVLFKGKQIPTASSSKERENRFWEIYISEHMKILLNSFWHWGLTRPLFCSHIWVCLLGGLGACTFILLFHHSPWTKPWLDSQWE